MKIIGVTGGVGSGKSALLNKIKENYNCEVIFSDNVANDIKKKGMIGYDKIVSLLGEDILISEGDCVGEIDKKKMAAKIFNDKVLLQKVNDILHPLTKEYILNQIDLLKKENKIDFLFIEAALLIESGYNKIVDEMWYIYADEDTRRVRLKSARGYSDEKIDSILKAQLSDKEYRQNSDFIVDNSRSLEDSLKQIEKRLIK